MNLKYKNITISGLPAAGSSTLGKALAEVLRWKYFSGGDFMRAYAIKKGLFDKKNSFHHDATVYSDEFDKKVDYGMRETLRISRKQILDSWLSGFVAQGIPGVLKILTFCSRDAVRVDRLVNRDDLTVDKAKKHIFVREDKNVKKWQRLYKNEWHKWVVDKGVFNKNKKIWFWYPRLYDLAIDTYKHSKEETLKIVLNKLGHKAKIDYGQVFI
jgi:cytidylate kinase